MTVTLYDEGFWSSITLFQKLGIAGAWNSLKYSSKLTCFSWRWKQRAWFELDFYLSITSVQGEKNKKTNMFSDVQTSLQKGNRDATLESQTWLRTSSTVACTVVNPSYVGVRASCMPAPRDLMPSDTSSFLNRHLMFTYITDLQNPVGY